MTSKPVSLVRQSTAAQVSLPHRHNALDRSVGADGSSSAESHNITQADQQPFRFLDLPSELRLIVYNYAFDSKVIHPTRSRRIQPRVHGRRFQGAFSLLFSCQQIRNEVKDFIYKCCVFDLQCYYDLPVALQYLGAQVCGSIRAIKIEKLGLFRPSLFLSARPWKPDDYSMFIKRYYPRLEEAQLVTNRWGVMTRPFRANVTAQIRDVEILFEERRILLKPSLLDKNSNSDSETE